MVATAQRNLAAAGCVAAYLVADAQHIPVATASCDAVVANHMLYHIPDRARALDEIRHVLKPDGILLAATNGVGHMAELHALAHRFNPSLPATDPSPSRFSFEDGLAELGARFAHVNLVRSDNSLVITEAEPLAAYMLSGIPGTVSPTQRGALHRFIAGELAEKGEIRITPVTGFLVASQPR